MPPLYAVGAGAVGSHLYSNLEGTTSPGEENHCGQICRATRWFLLETTNPGTLLVNTEGSSSSNVLALYRWDEDAGYLPGSGVCPSDTASFGTGLRRIRRQVQPGELYAVVSDGLSPDPGLIRLNWTIGHAPVLQSQYHEWALTAGTNVTLRVALPQGSPSPGVQWRLNGLPIAQATNLALLLSNVSTVHEGFYDVIASNLIDIVHMPVATVIVDYPLFQLTFWR